MQTFLEILKQTFEERQTEYAPPEISFEDIARGWEIILGAKVSAEQVALCMAWLKIIREKYTPKDDNVVDLGGYAYCLDKIKKAKRNNNVKHIPSQITVVA